MESKSDWLGLLFVLSVALALLAWGAVGALAGAESCERFAALSLEDQAQVLASNDRSDPECTAFLLRRLGSAHYDQASRTIANYLDFHWPEREPRDDGGSHMPWDGEVYPALDALYAIGANAIPALVEYLASADRPAVARKYAAVLVLDKTSNGDATKGVRVLVHASRGRKDPVEAGRLWKVAAEAVEMCPIDARRACLAVLLERSGP
jgi:hypothetical protein